MLHCYAWKNSWLSPSSSRAQAHALLKTRPPQSSASPSTAAAPAPAARPGDVDTIEHILAAVYDVISGPAGAPRDWDRFRTLYYPGARLIPTRRDDKGAITARVLTPEDFVTRGKEIFANQGFFETPIANRVEQWD